MKLDHQANGPIFIGGDGRSGTTLLSLVLNAHPLLTVGPELHFNGPENLGSYVHHCAELLDNGDPMVFGKGIKEHPELKKGVQFAKRCHRFGLSFKLLSELISSSMNSTKSNLSSFQHRCHLINAIGEARKADTNGQRWGIKIMREIAALSKYAKIWPNAQFIHIVRDGRDVASSQMKEHGGWGYGDISEAANKWSTLLRKVRKELNRHSVFEIRYEDLVGSPKESTQQLAEFLNVEWDEQMLNHSNLSQPLYTNPYNHPSIKSVSKPINDNAVQRYKKDLTSDQIELFNKIAFDELVHFDYELLDASTR